MCRAHDWCLEREDHEQEGWGQLAEWEKQLGTRGFRGALSLRRAAELGPPLLAHQLLPWTSPHLPSELLEGRPLSPPVAL